MVETTIRIDTNFDDKYESDFYDFREGFDSDYEYNNNYIIKCISCNADTLYGVMMNSDSENIIHFECVNCRGYYAVCFDCENPDNDTVKLAQLLEHHNCCDIKNDGDNYKIVPLPNDQYDDDDVKSKIVYTKPTYFYSEKLFEEFTGHDGGYTSTWKCDCSTRIVTDK